MADTDPTGDRGPILVVEDNLSTREFIRDLLLLHGYGVVTAVNGKDGVEKLGRGGIDLVVTDWNMPELDGVGVLRNAKQHHPDVPVVMVSASWDPAIRRSVQALSPAALLDKPVGPDEFLSTVRRLIGS